MKRIWMIAGMTVGLALAGCSTQEEPFVSSEGGAEEGGEAGEGGEAEEGGEGVACEPEVCGLTAEAPVECWDGTVEGKDCLDTGDGCGWVVTQPCPESPCADLECGSPCTIPCPPGEEPCDALTVETYCSSEGICTSSLDDLNCEAKPCDVSECPMPDAEPQVCADGSNPTVECLDAGFGCEWYTTEPCPADPCAEVVCETGTTCEVIGGVAVCSDEGGEISEGGEGGGCEPEDCPMTLEEPTQCWDGSVEGKDCLDTGNGCGWVVTQPCPENPCEFVLCETGTKCVPDGDDFQCAIDPCFSLTCGDACNPDCIPGEECTAPGTFACTAEGQCVPDEVQCE